LNYVAACYKEQKYRFTITTTTPALIWALQSDKHWKLTRQGRAAAASKKSKIELSKRNGGSDSTNRITTSWEYKTISV